MTESSAQSQSALACELIGNLRDDIATLQKEKAELERKYQTAWAIAGSASVNAESLRQFGYDYICNVCSFAGQTSDEVIGTTGTSCDKCEASICLDCNDNDRAM